MRVFCLGLVVLTLARHALAAGTEVVPKADVRAIQVALEGVVPGGWTMDFEAAKAFAASNDLPLFLSFTGSDWCGYCIQAEREIFALPEWQVFASNRLVLVNIDLPRNPKLIPAAVRSRNEAVQDAFEVQQFPTFLVLEKDGRTVLKQFGLARDSNPANFIRETAMALRRRPAEMRRFLAGMSEGQAAAYSNLLARLDQIEKDAQAWLQTRPEKNAENMKKFQGFMEQSVAVGGAINDFETEKFVGDLSGDGRDKAVAQIRAAREQIAVLAELQAARSALDDWLLSRPMDTPSNRQRLQELMKRLSDVQARLK